MFYFLILFAFVFIMMVIDPVKAKEIASPILGNSVSTQSNINQPKFESSTPPLSIDFEPQQSVVESTTNTIKSFVNTITKPIRDFTQNREIDFQNREIDFQNREIDFQFDDDIVGDPVENGSSFNWKIIIYIIIIVLFLILITYIRKWISNWFQSSKTNENIEKIDRPMLLSSQNQVSNVNNDVDGNESDNTEMNNQEVSNENNSNGSGKFIIQHPEIPPEEQINLKEKVCHPCPTCECPDCPKCECTDCPECICSDYTGEISKNNSEIQGLKWMIRYLGVKYRREQAVQKAIRETCPGIFAQAPPKLDYNVQNTLKHINRDRGMSEYFQQYLPLYTGIPRNDAKKIL